MASQVDCHHCHIKGHIICQGPVLLEKNERPEIVGFLGNPLTGKPFVLDGESVKGEVPDGFRYDASEGFFVFAWQSNTAGHRSFLVC